MHMFVSRSSTDFSLFRVNNSSVLGLGASQVFISLENEERPRPNASGKSWPARAELDHSGRDSPTYRNRVYFCEGWFSQHLARAYSLPAILHHTPGSTTLAIKGSQIQVSPTHWGACEGWPVPLGQAGGLEAFADTRKQ